MRKRNSCVTFNSEINGCVFVLFILVDNIGQLTMQMAKTDDSR